MRAMTWLRRIEARALRHLSPLIIALDEDAPRSLVILGASGSGKSSLLAGIAGELDAGLEGRAHPADDVRAPIGEARDRALKLAHLGRPVRVIWSDPAVASAHAEGRLVLAHLRLPRAPSFLAAPRPTPTDTDPKPPDAQVAPRLVQLLVNRKTEQTLARESADPLREQLHASWFLRVRSALRKLLHQPGIGLAFDAGGVQLDLPDGRRVGFGELSLGHATAVTLWAEVMIRVEAARLRNGDGALEPHGVVLIDHPEANLDPRLQRELLPALAELYPRVQWIVTTHSPLVAMSLDDATVFDLVRREATPSGELRKRGIEPLLLAMLGFADAAPSPSKSAPSVPPPAALPPRRQTVEGPGPWKKDG
ncbi:MAG: hypothetical protein SangKO_034080 [Sandaracinaceae bacterium]